MSEGDQERWAQIEREIELERGRIHRESKKEKQNREREGAGKEAKRVQKREAGM